MKCSVPGCDTDEQIVSYTSVFFVNFPSDALMQQQWLEMLSITDPKLIRALLAGEAKVCSCHFTEECFGHHPVYGFRYLLPKALPTELPLLELMHEQPNMLSSDPDETPSDYYFMYMPDPCEATAPFPTREVLDNAGPSDVDDLVSVVAPPKLEDEDEEGLEEIGIEYANGKYYFLKLNEEPVEETYGQTSSVQETSDIPTHRMDTWGFFVGTGNEPPSDKAVAVGEPVEDTTSPESPFIVRIKPQDELPTNADGILDPEDLIDGPLETSSQQSAPQEVRKRPDVEEALANDDLEAACIVEDVEDETAEAEEASCEPDETQSEETVEFLEHSASEAEQGSENDAEYVLENDESESHVYGAIEALDEVSISGDNVCVRPKNQRIDRHFCSECGKGFPYPSGLNKHMLVHTKIKAHSCEQCGRSFAQKVNLDVHMQLHTGIRPKHRYTCEVCGKKSYRRSEFLNHLEVHRRNYPLACPHCNSRFTTMTSLYTHLRQEHAPDVTMQQFLAGLAQISMAEIIVDSKPSSVANDERGVDGRWTCSVCGQRFALHGKLRKHKRKMHPKIFHCKYCPRQFQYRSMLEKHLPVHTHEKPFRCTHCPGSFTQRCNLVKHIQTKHSEIIRIGLPEDEVLVEELDDSRRGSFQCTRCDKTFSRVSTWLAHYESTNHCSNDPQPTCDICGLSFASKNSLANHCKRLHQPVEERLSDEKLQFPSRYSFLDEADRTEGEENIKEESSFIDSLPAED